MINHIIFGKGEKYVIFLHGWGGSCDSFRGLARFLSSDYRVILIDFYGFGETSFPEDRILKLDDYVLSILELIFYYKINSFSIVAHSFGGRVAIKIASQYGNLVEKIVFVDSAGIRPRRGLSYLYRIIKAKFFKLMKINKNLGSDDYKKLNFNERQTFKKIVNEDLTKNLKKINNETLIVWGEKDKDTPLYMGKYFHKKIKNSNFIIFKNCGHFAYVEQHAIFCKIVINFLQGVEDELNYRHIDSNSRNSRTIKIPVFIAKQ